MGECVISLDQVISRGGLEHLKIEKTKKRPMRLGLFIING
jgi:hypothetical protein